MSFDQLDEDHVFEPMETLLEMSPVELPLDYSHREGFKADPVETEEESSSADEEETSESDVGSEPSRTKSTDERRRRRNMASGNSGQKGLANSEDPCAGTRDMWKLLTHHKYGSFGGSVKGSNAGSRVSSRMSTRSKGSRMFSVTSFREQSMAMRQYVDWTSRKERRKAAKAAPQVLRERLDVSQYAFWRVVLFQMLFRHSKQFSKFVSHVLLLLIVISITFFVLSTDNHCYYLCPRLFDFVEASTVLIFTVEFCLRLSCVGVSTHWRKMKYPELQWAFTFEGLIYIASIVPWWVQTLEYANDPSSQVAMTAIKSLRGFRILNHQISYRGVKMLTRVIYFNKELMAVATMIGFILILCTSTILYAINVHSDPQFSSIPKSMYLSVLMLSQQGIPPGDMNLITMVIVVITVILSVAVFAIPASMLTWGFEAEAVRYMKLRQQQKKQAQIKSLPESFREFKFDDGLISASSESSSCFESDDEFYHHSSSSSSFSSSSTSTASSEKDRKRAAKQQANKSNMEGGSLRLGSEVSDAQAFRSSQQDDTVFADLSMAGFGQLAYAKGRIEDLKSEVADLKARLKVVMTSSEHQVVGTFPASLPATAMSKLNMPDHEAVGRRMEP